MLLVIKFVLWANTLVEDVPIRIFHYIEKTAVHLKRKIVWPGKKKNVDTTKTDLKAFATYNLTPDI